MIDTYLNDCSAQEQFSTWNENGVLKVFVNLACKTTDSSQIYVDKGNIFMARLSPQHMIANVLDNDRDVYTQLQRVIEKSKDPKMDEIASYEVNAVPYVQRIIGGAFETNNQSLLINFPNSTFGSRAVSITKNGANAKLIEQIESEEEWNNYLKTHTQVKPYTENDIQPPMDEQTILVNTDIFEPTKRREQGRIRYRKKDNGEIWYVDNGHYGKSAHLEVFDAEGIHIGICKIDDMNSFVNKPKPGRTIEI